MKEKLEKLSKSSTGSFILLIIAVIYTISPIDLVPDVIPIIGWIDDIGLDGTAIFLVVKGVLDRKAASYIAKEGNKSTAKKVVVNSGNTIKESKKMAGSSTGKEDNSETKDNNMKCF